MTALETPNLKKDKRMYRVTTIIVTIMTAGPALFYFNNKYLIDSIHRLGFPDYFRIELAIGKIIGALIMFIPAVPNLFKEWVYAAFGITLLSGALAHGLVDGPAKGFAPLVPFAILCVSYYYFRKVNYAK